MPESNHNRPNGKTCELCNSDCVDDCIVCGAPQCCPKCCQEGLMEVVATDPVTGTQLTGWDIAMTNLDFTIHEMKSQQH